MIEAEFYPYYNTDREDNQHCVYIKDEVYIMRRIYIVTGAAGHLGSTIIRMLLRQGECVRGLILPTEQVKSRKNVQYFCCLLYTSLLIIKEYEIKTEEFTKCLTLRFSREYGVILETKRDVKLHLYSDQESESFPLSH